LLYKLGLKKLILFGNLLININENQKRFFCLTIDILCSTFNEIEFFNFESDHWTWNSW